MEKLAIHIVEDEAVIAMDLEDIVTELGHHVTGISASYEDVMRILPTDQSDLYLVDIQLKGSKSGIEVAHELSRHGKVHIYISSLSAKNIIEQARKTGAQGYILKPFSPDDIYVAVQMATGRLGREGGTHAIYIREGKGRTRILMNDIIYAKADGHYTHLYTQKRTHTLLSDLKYVQLNYLNNPFFLRVHRSYVVNTRHILQKEAGNIIMSEGSIIPLSRNFKKDIF